MTRKTISPVPLGNIVAQGVGIVRSWGQWFVTLRDALNGNAAQLGRADAGTAATRPATYTSDDAGSLYLATDTDALAVWDGAKWVNFAGDAPGWQGWTPTYTPSGGMTLSGVTTTTAKYLKGAARVDFDLFFSATLGGTLSIEIDVSLPIAPTSDVSIATALVLPPGGGWTPAICFLASQLLIRQSAEAVFTAGAWSFLVSGSYRI